jgi:hypothetical protein
MLDEDRDRSASQIYNQLQVMGMKHTGASPCYSDSLQFPAETLKTKQGDCGDLSVLFAAMLEVKGIKSVIIKSNDTVLSGYVTAGGAIIPIDLQNIQKRNYTQAKEDGIKEYAKDSAVVYPQDEWVSGTKNVNLGIDVLAPNIITTSQNCVFLNNEFKVNYWFENKGYESGMRCLKAVLSEGPSTYFSKRVCVELPNFEKRNITFSLNTPKKLALSEKCWID